MKVYAEHCWACQRHYHQMVAKREDHMLHVIIIVTWLARRPERPSLIAHLWCSRSIIWRCLIAHHWCPGSIIWMMSYCTSVVFWINYMDNVIQIMSFRTPEILDISGVLYQLPGLYLIAHLWFSGSIIWTVSHRLHQSSNISPCVFLTFLPLIFPLDTMFSVASFASKWSKNTDCLCLTVVFDICIIFSLAGLNLWNLWQWFCLWYYHNRSQ